MKSLLLLLLIMGTTISSYACDICGCSAQGASLGLLPGVSSHFVGLRYHYRHFRSDHPPVFSQGSEEWSEDYFSTTELWGRWSVIPRVEVFAFVPVNHYAVNQFSEGELVHQSTNTGLGDVSVLVNTVILRTADKNPTANLQHQWLLGGGLKAPTGNFGQVDAERGIVLPNMQLGTGSWDFSVVSNYRLQWGNWGLNANASYRYNTPNELRYQFGQIALGSLDFLHVFELNRNKIQIIPQLGMRWEGHTQDYSNKSRGDLNEYSGGHFIHASAGLDAYWGKFGMNVRSEIPVYQNFAQGYVRNEWRFSVGALYLIQTKK